MPSQSQYDAAIVGASIAGCAAAIFLGRAGARVALIERDRDPAGYKKLCTHPLRDRVAPIPKTGLSRNILRRRSLALRDILHRRAISVAFGA